MTSAEFHTILEKPHLVAQANIDELRELAQKYSYSQIFQLLYAMRLRYSSEHLFDRQLAKTSLLSNDRQVLFQMFKENNFPVEGYEKEQNEPAEESREIKDRTDTENTREHERETVGTKEGNERVNTNNSEKVSKEENLKIQPQQKSPAPEKDTQPKPTEKERAKRESSLPKTEKTATEKEEVKELSLNEKVAAILAKNRALKNELDLIKKNRDTNKEEKTETANAEEGQGLRQSAASSSSVKLQSLAEEPDKIEPKVKPVKEEPAVENVARKPKEAGQEESPRLKAKTQEDELAATVFMGAVEWEAVETQSDKTAEKKEEKEDLEAEYLEIEALAAQHQKQNEAIILVDETQQIDKDASTNEQEDQKGANENITEEEAQELSFSRWLKQISASRSTNPEKAEKPKETSQETSTASGNLEFEQKIQLLDSFVEKLPDLKKRREPIPPPPPTKRQFSNQDPSLVTETLAKVYLRQKHYKKAIKAYEILKLKYPEKSSFFASQILEIKNLANS